MLLIAGGAYGFVLLADEVSEGDTRAVDERILLSLRNPADPTDPLGPLWFEEAARDVTALGSITVLTLMTVVVVCYLLWARFRGHALLVAISVGGGALAMTLLKRGFERPRPDLVPHLAHVSTASFPSGHAMLSAVVYLTLGALLAQAQARRRLGIYFLAVAILLTIGVGASRVYLGVHWPSDVVAGWCAGTSWALMCWLIAAWLRARHALRDPEAITVENEADAAADAAQEERRDSVAG
jgi:undecaprenyl-diphosphatase